MKTNKQITLDNLKEAYNNNLITLGRHSLQAYQDLKKGYKERSTDDFNRLNREEVQRFDHLRSLLIRAEYLERIHDINKVKESENIAVKLERHQYAPEMNKAYFYRILNKSRHKLGNIATPQATTISEAIEALNNTQLKNICLYV